MRIDTAAPLDRREMLARAGLGGPRYVQRVLRALPPGLILVINLVFGLFVMAIGVELVVHGIANHGAIVRAH